MFRFKFEVFAALAGCALVACSCAAPRTTRAENPFGVRITPVNDRLRVELNGKLFTEYYYTNVPRPFCYPLLGPGGISLTRNFPMTNAPGEEHDHPHHRSLWFAHGAVNKNDFWTEGKGAGRIVHRGFAEILSGTRCGVIRTINDWVSAEGKVICTDEEALRFHAPESDESILLDVEVTLRAGATEVVLGDTKEGTFAVRVAESMRVLKPLVKAEKPQAGEGQIVLSTGLRDDGASAVAAKQAKRETATWGQRAEWCDYFGPVAGKVVGIAIFDHPQNPNHPTWWHVRDYGLLAANPFGRHEFEKLSDREAGTVKIPAGQSITFRYRIVLHADSTKAARIAERYADYCKEPLTTGK